MSSMPITAIEVGDTVTTGYGTQTITRHIVSEIVQDCTYGPIITVKCEDGYRFNDTPNGFWYSVTKADPQAEAAAQQAANAYARAWDRKW